MTVICLECGASLSEGGSCQSIFDQFLVLEFTDPAYGAVHFLTVACFMIQHGRYSDEGLAWIQPILRTYVEGDMTPQQLRKVAAQGTGSDSRKWKVLRAAGNPPPPRIAWSMTIADVAARYTDAESYCELVTEWARRTVSDLAAQS